MSARTFICTCEDVTLEEIEHALATGLHSIEEIKRYTGLGTGICQGKQCMVALVDLLRTRGLAGDDVQPFTVRPPTEPVTLGELAALNPHALGLPPAPEPTDG